MKSRTIPWDIIISGFKGEITLEGQMTLNEWLTDERNMQLYNELYNLWFSIIQKNMNFESNVDMLWKKMKQRIDKSQTQSKKKNFHPFYIVSVAACTLLLLFLAFSTYFKEDNTPEIASAAYTYHSLNGKSKVLLPDGSVVWLNTQSSITYYVLPDDKQRKISLHGEAYFDVAKDENRPFLVKCGNTEIEVFGTCFNVDSNNETVVSLLSGSVFVKTVNNAKRIIPGEIAVCDNILSEIKISKGDVNFDAIWANESISFERKSLRELSSYLSKWYGVKIIIEPDIPDDQAYTFKITTEPLEEILRLMARSTPIQYSFNEENLLRISRNSQNIMPME